MCACVCVCVCVCYGGAYVIWGIIMQSQCHRMVLKATNVYLCDYVRETMFSSWLNLL